MFVGCSVINISFIAKQVQHVGIIRAFRLPRGDLLYTFFSACGDASCGLLGKSVPRMTICSLDLYFDTTS